MDAMPVLQAAGLQTNVEVIGKGPKLLMLHGWANTWESWLPVIPFLSDHFTLILPELPGCGKTETPTSGWSTQDHSLWLDDLCKNPVIGDSLSSAVGHSYGGKILLWNQSQASTIVFQKLILMDSSGIPAVLSSKQKLLTALATMTPAFLKGKLSTKIRGKVYSSFGVDSDYVVANEFQKQTLRIILKEDLTERLAKISAKTLLVWGKHDTSTPLWQGESMHTLIPLNQLKSYATGHFPHHEMPIPVGQDMLSFLQE